MFDNKSTSKIPVIHPEEVNLPSLEHIEQSDKLTRIEPYLHDESRIIKGQASNIFFPSSTPEIATILKSASQNNIQVTVSGGGTGLASSRVPKEGWIIATDKLNSVQSQKEEKSYTWVDPESNRKFEVSIVNATNNLSQPPCIRVPVSMTVRSVALLAKKLGWFYPPDPTERTAFIGGNVATSASGARSFKYGSTRSYVRELKIVLSTGQILILNRNQGQNSVKAPHNWLISSSKNDYANGESMKIELPHFERPNVRKNVIFFPQYENMPLYEIFIGTEGIFGVISEVVLQLKPAPKKIISIISFFSNNKDALLFVNKAREHRERNISPIPMSIEYVDPNALTFIRQKTTHIHDDANVAVYFEQEIFEKDSIDDILENWLNDLDEANVIDSWAEMDEQGIERHKEFRHALPQGVQNFMKKFGVSRVATDFAVPNQHFLEMFNYYLEIGAEFEQYLKERNTLQSFPAYTLYGHIGDSHLHFNFLPRNLEEQKRANEFYLDLVTKVLELQGTIAAEHGVGKKKYGGKPYIEYMIELEGIEKLRTLKSQLDPANILNRGNMFS